MYRPTDPPFESARGHSANTERKSLQQWDQNCTQNKFPFKKFSHKVQASGNIPVSPNTDRAHRASQETALRLSLYSSRTNLQQRESTASIYYKNGNPLNFLSNYPHNATKKAEDKENLKLNLKKDSYRDFSTLTTQQICKQLQQLNERMLKNESQIQKLKFAEIIQHKQADSSDLSCILKENKSMLNKGFKSQQLKSFRSELDSMKQKIKQCQKQISLALPKKSFEERIQGLQWKFKSFNTPLQKGQISDIISLEIEKSYKALQQALQSKIKEINKTVNEFKSCAHTKDSNENHNQTRLRSTRFASKSISFKYEEKISMSETYQNGHSELRFNNPRSYTREKFFKSENHGSDSKKEHLLTEKTYFIDPEGYLLDDDKCYLLDSKQRLIKLPHRDLEVLRSLGILS